MSIDYFFVLIAGAFGFSATTLTIFTLAVLPLNFFFLFETNFTYPALIANRVSSLPLFTLRPGEYLVPLCLMIMFPTLAAPPSDIFTPKRWEAESRPNLLTPPEFL